MNRHGVPYPTDGMRLKALENDMRVLMRAMYFNMFLMVLLSVAILARS
jgi:hypothetical protein